MAESVYKVIDIGSRSWAGGGCSTREPGDLLRKSKQDGRGWQDRAYRVRLNVCSDSKRVVELAAGRHETFRG